jgi:hypothetical protein
LNDNPLTGPIPTEIGQCTAINYLYLSGNQLSGPIPTEIGQCTAITTLYLYDNQLSGPIPAEIGQCTAITRLHLENNQLTGAGPGVCTIMAGIISGVIAPNPAWTDPAQCPVCLNVLTVPNGVFCTATSLHESDRWIACRDSGGTLCDDGFGNLGTILRMISKGITGVIPPADLAQMTALTELCVRAAALRRPHASFATAAHAHLAPPRRHRAHSPSRAPSTRARFDTRRRWLHNNQLTGAGMGICSIVAGITFSDLGTNPAWTDPAQCPECLNTLTAPVTCTGANSVAPTQVPTHAPTHAPTTAAPQTAVSQTAVSQTAASPAVTIATACLGALAFLIVGSWFVGIVIAVLVLIILHKKKKPAAQAESKDAPVVVELVARIN